MKQLLLLLSLFMFVTAYSQTVVLQEDFEGSTYQFTSSAANGSTSWGISDFVSSGGVYSDSAQVATGDTFYLTSNSFNTTGNMNVILEFDHICKISFFDYGYIEVSNDNGATWSRVNTSMYLMGDTNQFMFSRFNAGGYVDWLVANNNAVPTNSWWKPEKFDISSYAANSANVKVRFMLVDGNGMGALGARGWFIDDISITMAIDEIIPPSITLLPPIPQDTVYGGGPFNVTANISDNSGIDTAIVIYTYYPENITDTVGMTMITTDTFQGGIPFQGYGRTYNYIVKAVDASTLSNESTTNQYSFFNKYSDVNEIIIGTCNDNTYYSPMYISSTTSSYYYSMHSSLYEASEFNNIGGLISSISFNKSNDVGYTANDADFDIYIKEISSTTVPQSNSDWLTETSTATLVYSSSTQNINTFTGWQDFQFTTPFNYSGSGNLLVMTKWYRPSSPTANYPRWCSDPVGSTKATTFSASTWPPTYTYHGDRPMAKFGFESQPLTNDVGVNSYVYPTGGVLANSNFDVKVDVKNYGLDTITSADIYWEINGNSGNTYSFTDTILPDSITLPLTLGTLNLSPGVHNLKAWTDNPNGSADLNIANDTLYFSFYGCPSLLNGTYTIGGTGADYATFADAALALNQCGINGPVTFNVASGTYTEQFILEDISGSSATNTITFQSTAGDSTTVIVEYEAANGSDNYVVRLNETKYITFTDMTFQSLDTTYGKVFDIVSTASDLTFTNNVIRTNMPGYDDSENMALIYGVGGIGDNITIQNNYLENGSRAVTLTGATSNNWDVSNNMIYGHHSVGVVLGNVVSPMVKNNHIEADTMSLSQNHNGIVLNGASGTAEVSYNTILTQSTNISYGINVASSSFDSLNPAMVYNNMISLYGSSTSTTLSCGILNYGSNNINYYHNTAHFEGSQTNAATMCIYENNANTSNIDIRNNIFTNNAGGYIYYLSGVDTSLFSNNYNNLFNWGNGTFAYLGAAVADISDWKTETGNAQNSVSYDPYYTSTADLHVSNNYLNNIGTPIASITDDIDGDPRSTTVPDMGADEYDASPYDAASLQVLAPIGACGLDSNEVVVLQIKNIGSATISGNLTASYKIIQSSNTVTESVTATILPGDTLDYTFTTTVNLDVTYSGSDSTFNMIAWVDLLNDPIQQNDSVYFDVESKYEPLPPITSDTSVVYGNSITLTAISNDSLIWYQYDTSTTELERTNNFTTPLLYDTTTYWVSAGGGAGQLLITEIVQFETGSGYTNPYPSWITGVTSGDFDGVEMTNVGSGPLNLSGYTLNFYSTYTSTTYQVNGTYTFPSGVIVPPGQVVVVDIKSTSAVDDYTNFYFGAGLSGNPQSAATQAYWIEDPSGTVVDAVATNGQTFAASTGVTAADWSGSIPSSSGKAGVTRLIIDNNTASDWGVAGTNPTMQSFGSPNPMLPLIAGGSSTSCESARIPLTVNVTDFPTDDAGISAITNPGLSAMSGIYHDIEVVLNNYGIDTLYTVDIIYSIPPLYSDTFNYVGALEYGGVDTIVIDSLNLSGGVYSLITYTDMPNGVQDTINTNDTAYHVFNSCLSGTYTIGDTTGGVYKDFVSFTDAVNALNGAGVCGNVTFLVDSGTYTEQITITEITGVGPYNQVEFTSANGDSTSVVLEYAGTSSTNLHTVYLDGADYITFSHMTLKASGTSYGRIVTLDGGANNNSFLNNVFDMPASTSSYFAAIYSTGDIDDSLKVINNHIINGGYGLYIRGAGSTTRERGVHIENNYIDGAAYYAAYFYYQDSLQFLNNVVREGSNSTYFYGLYFGYIFDNFRIGNNIFNAIDGGTSTKYGMRVYYANYYTYYNPATDGPGYVYNNMINIRSGTSTKYGLYAYYGNDVHYYYNTIKVAGAGSTARALYQYNSTSSTIGETFMNNNFIDSVGYQAAYFSTPATINTIDYNNYYTEGGDISYWGGTTSATLSAHQTASGKDANSLNINPQFMANDDLHLLSTQLSGYGYPVSAVITDIDGQQRSTIATTIGADEVPLLPVDIGITTILDVPDPTYEGYSYTPRVIVRNYGTDSITAYQIDYTINGGTPISYTVINSDTLWVGDIDTIQLPSFNSPAGNSIICATTVLSADSNAFNDGTCQNFFGIPVKDAFATAIEDIDDGCGIGLDTVSIWIKNIGVDTINGPGQTTPPTVNFMNDLGVGATVYTENLTTVIYPGDSTLYTFVTLVDLTNSTQYDSVFTVTAWVDYPGDNVSYNDTVYTDVNSFHIPNDPTFTTPISVPYGTQVTLYANSIDSIYWYATDTSSSEFNIGSSYTTGFNYVDTSYWLEAVGSSSGASPELLYYKFNTPGTSVQNFATNPVGNNPATITGGLTIGGVGFNGTGLVGTGGSSSSNVINTGWSTNLSNGFTISFWTSNVPSSSTLYYIWGDAGASSFRCFTNGVAGANNWMVRGGGLPDLAIDGAATMNPNLIHVVYDATTGEYTSYIDGVVATTLTATTNVTVSGTGFTIGGYASNSGLNGIMDEFKIYDRPLTLTEIMNDVNSTGGSSCTSNRVEMVIDVTGQLDIDVSAFQINAPVSQIGLTAATPLQVTVTNFGLLDHDTIPIAYELDGAAPVYDTVYPTIQSGNSTNFTFSQPMDLSTVGQTYNIKVYVHDPLDSNQYNDTISKSVTNMPLNYCACSATSTSYEDLTGISIDNWSHTSQPVGSMYTDFTSVTPTAFISPGVTHNISVTSDFPSGYSYQYTCWTNVFIDYNKDGDFDDAGERVYGASTQSSNTVSGTFTVPFNALSGNTMMRVVLRESGTVSNTGPCGTYTWGETEDYMISIAPQIPNDIGVELVSNPPIITDVPTHNLEARIRNYGTDSQTSFYMYYEHNNSLDSVMVTPTSPLLFGDSVDVVVPNITLQQGQNYFDVYTSLPGDSNLFNDAKSVTSYLQVVLSAPYYDNFDDSINIWFNDTVSNQWEWGVPNGTTLNQAYTAPNVMATKLDTFYQATPATGDYLYSPKFLIGSNIDSLLLKFQHIMDIDATGDDRGNIQWSENGTLWQTIGHASNDVNGTYWYDNTINGDAWWTTTQGAWQESTYKIDFFTTTSPFNGVDTIQFRYVFAGDGSSSSDGWLIDNFHLSMVPIAQDVHIVEIIDPADNVATGTIVAPKVKVYNAGTQPLTSISMSYEINSGAPITETWTPSPAFAPGDTLIYTFGTTYTSLNTDYTIFVEGDAAGDIYQYNDTLGKTVNSTPAMYDAMISEIVYPWDTTGMTPCPPKVIVKIKNVGVNTLTSIPVEYTAFGNTTTSVWVGSLASGDSVNYEFPGTYTSQLGNYQLCARTNLTTDGNPGNDEDCKQLIGVVTYCDSILDGIDNPNAIGFILGQNQPNPASGNYEIEYELPKAGQVHFEIRNSLGQVIYVEEGERKAGVHTLKLDASKLASGVYYYSMDFEKVRKTKKMVVTK